MKTLAAAALLQLCLCAAATISSNGTTETTVTAAPGHNALLPCYTVGNVTPTSTTWTKNGREVAGGGASSPARAPSGQRLAVLHDGSLSVARVTPGDEGSYVCRSVLPGNNTFRARVLLQVAGGPENVSTSAGPAAAALPNGTLVVHRGATVTFNCTASSYPPPRLTWAFRGASGSNASLLSAPGSWLAFTVEHVQPAAQGVYSCTARNPASQQAANKSTQLLVYYVPGRHPECMWAEGDPSHVQLRCSWFGAYPAPTLRWAEERGGRGAGGAGAVSYASAVTDSLEVTLNRSELWAGQTLRCTGRHPALPSGTERSCSLTLKPPFPEGEPLLTALEASSVSLSCTEAQSSPPANTTWTKGLQQESVVAGPKYAVSVEGPVVTLTILNVSRDDEGVYFCRSENPLAVRELEVYLTVRTSSAYTGAIIGVFIAALIVGSAVIVAKIIYSSRHRICLGSGFGQMEEERGDVLSLVESDDEQVFQDAVPRLPPLANGRHTTLVQIHRIPSSDHEEAEPADTNSQQQQEEEGVQTEEPVELVTF